MTHPAVRVTGEGRLPDLPPWVELLHSWNESLPDGHKWRYNHRGNLRRDFHKAFDQIVNYYR
jgi:hypothetical protein